MWRYYFLLVFLNLMDTFDTAKYLQVTGIEGEGNPMMRAIIAQHGTTGTLVAKGIGILVCGIFMWLARNDFAARNRIKKYLIFANCVYAIIVLWGLFLLVTL